MNRVIGLAIAVLALVAAGLGAQTISSTPSTSMPVANGSVNEFVEYKNLVLIGGTFSTVNGTTRMGLAAFDKTSGALHSWNPTLAGGGVSDMLVVGDTLYIAGKFNSVDGNSRTQLASFDLTQLSQSGHGLTSWAPVLSNKTNVFFFGNDVQCLCTMNSILYVGGFFGQVNGSTRGGLASFDLSKLGTNSGLTQWDPNTWTNNGLTGTGFEIWGVFNMVPHQASGDVAISGPFEGVGGTHMDDGTASPNTATARQSFAVVDGSGTGAVRSFAPALSNAAWNDDAMQILGDIVFHGGQRSASPRSVDLTAAASPYTSFNPNANDQAYPIGVHPSGSPVVMAGIWTTIGGAAANSLLAFDGTTGGVVSGWDPNPDATPATILVTADRVYVGGPFTTISGKSVSGMAVYDIVAGVQITTSPTLPGGTAGQNYSQQFAAAGGQPTLAWSATGLPGGWSMSSTGLLTASAGAVTPGTFNFDVRVDDSIGQYDQISCSVNISAPKLNITTGATLPTGTEGVAYSTTLNASGGWGSYSWSISSGSLPSGWSLAASTGVISAPAGSVIAGNYSFTAQVKDGVGQTAAQGFSVTVNAAGSPLTITTNPTLPNGLEGTAYALQFAATGGQGTYTWSIVSTNLGSGWGINSTTGQLTAGAGIVIAGSYTLTVQVADSLTTDSQACSLVIDYPALQITTTTLGNGIEGTPYAGTVDVIGGSGGYVWTVDSGSLPGGVTMNAPAGNSSAGLSGTPSTAGTFNFVIRVTDSQSSTTTQAFTVVIDPAGTVPPPGGSGEGSGNDGGSGCAAQPAGPKRLGALIIFLGQLLLLVGLLLDRCSKKRPAAQ